MGQERGTEYRRVPQKKGLRYAWTWLTTWGERRRERLRDQGVEKGWQARKSFEAGLHVRSRAEGLAAGTELVDQIAKLAEEAGRAQGTVETLERVLQMKLMADAVAAAQRRSPEPVQGTQAEPEEPTYTDEQGRRRTASGGYLGQYL